MDEKERLKQIPLIVMLFAAGLTAVISLFSEITFGMFLLRIFIASVAFYVVGTVVQILFAYALESKVEAKKEPVNDKHHGNRSGVSDETDKTNDDDDYSDEEDEEDEGF